MDLAAQQRRNERGRDRRRVLRGGRRAGAIGDNKLQRVSWRRRPEARVPCDALLTCATAGARRPPWRGTARLLVRARIASREHSRQWRRAGSFCISTTRGRSWTVPVLCRFSLGRRSMMMQAAYSRVQWLGWHYL